MDPKKYPLEKFSEQDIEDMLPAMKIGILGTVTPEGLPHLTMITTLMASSPSEVAFGQFITGVSKEYIRKNPRTGFLVMGLDKSFWTGRADYTHSTKSGKEYDFYNNEPLFRYNSYFGINTVHYLDLKGQSGKHPLPMNRVIFAAVKTLIGRSLAFRKSKKKVMNEWTQAFITKLDSLKFIGYVDAEGYPVIIPAIQAQCLDSEHVVFSFGAFGDELAQIPPYTPVAVFCMKLSMEDVLVRGTYQGTKRLGGVKCGVVQVDWVYNAMPPKPEQIYPEVPIKTVTEF